MALVLSWASWPFFLFSSLQRKRKRKHEFCSVSCQSEIWTCRTENTLEGHLYTHSTHFIALWVQCFEGSAHTNLFEMWKLRETVKKKNEINPCGFIPAGALTQEHFYYIFTAVWPLTHEHTHTHIQTQTHTHTHTHTHTRVQLASHRKPLWYLFSNLGNSWTTD